MVANRIVVNYSIREQFVDIAPNYAIAFVSALVAYAVSAGFYGSPLLMAAIEAVILFLGYIILSKLLKVSSYAYLVCSFKERFSNKLDEQI